MPEASDTELFERAESLLQNGQTLLLDGDDFSAVSLLDRKRAAGFELLFDRGESFQRQIHIGL